MKKLISIILAVMMVVALSVAVFAEQPANGLYVEAIDDGKGIIALNVYAVGAIEQMTLGQVAISYPASGVTPVKPDKTTEISSNVTAGVADYYTLADGFTSWTSGSIKLKTVSSVKYVSYNITTADAVNVRYSQASGKTLLFTAYMASTVKLDADSFAVSSLTGMNASLTTKISVSSGTIAIKDDASMFALDFIPATPDEPTDKPIAEDFAATATEAGATKVEDVTSGTVSYGEDANGNPYSAEMGGNGKVHTFFAKTPTALKALEYGVTATIEVDGTPTVYKFPGKADVEANQAWAIKIVIPNGTFMGGKTAVLTSMDKY